MKLPITLSIVATIFGSTQAAFLRSTESDARIRFDITNELEGLECTIDIGDDKDKCYNSKDHSDNKCMFCTGPAGRALCVTADIAANWEKVPRADVTCSASPSSGDDTESTELSTDFSSLKCTLSAFTDKEKCAHVDSESCQYCQLDVAGQEAGLCVGADIASKLANASDKVSCTSPSVDVDVDVGVPWPKLWKVYSCTIKAGTDEDKCHNIKDVDGEACEFCSITTRTSVCATSELGDTFKEQSPSITCDTKSPLFNGVESVGESADVSTDISSLKCTRSAFTDKEKCAQVASESCQYCELDIAGQETGLCVGADIASKLANWSNNVSCTSPSVDVDVDVDADADVGASWLILWKFYSCTLKAGTDEDKCHNSKDVDGKACEICSIATSASICATTELGNKLKEQSPAITCDAKSSLVDEVESVREVGTCLKAGLSGDVNACQKTADGDNGGHCILCRSHIDNLGLCMPFSYLGKTTTSYNCDASHRDVSVSTE